AGYRRIVLHSIFKACGLRLAWRPGASETGPVASVVTRQQGTVPLPLRGKIPQPPDRSRSPPLSPGRGTDGHYCPPPHGSGRGFPAYGSHHGWVTAPRGVSYAASLRSTPTRLCVRSVRWWAAFPMAPLVAPLSSVMGSSTSAERQPLASRRRSCCLRP